MIICPEKSGLLPDNLMIHKNSLYIILVLNVVIIYGRLWFDKYFIGYCDKKLTIRQLKLINWDQA